MDEDQPVVWVVGGSAATQRQARLLGASGQLAVQPLQLRPAIEDYTDLAAGTAPGAVLISGSLTQQTDAAYSSQQLADYLRALREQLPIFLLVDDGAADTGGAAFDGAVQAGDLATHAATYVARILRAVGRYDAALSAQQRRVQYLLDGQANGQLSQAEEAELAALRADLQRPAEARQSKQLEASGVDLAEKRDMVAQLESLTEKLEQLRRNR